jgi:pyruvate formate lyase activating enzyme
MSFQRLYFPVYCKLCEKERTLSKTLPYCPDCIRDRFEEIESEILEIHGRIRRPYGLPELVPDRGAGIRCPLCVNRCNIGEGEFGYCGVRQNIQGGIAGPETDWAYADWYHDPLPTNCVADWVCRGSKDQGYTNLAVFYEACTFNCLFCQNWHYRDRKNRVATRELLQAVDATTGCVCFFGGDPTPFAFHNLEFAKQIQDRNRKIRICWETNASISPELMERWVDYALATEGCVKIDFKTCSENLNIALCGTSNSNTKLNVELVAKSMVRREKPPLLIVSTLLIPGYIDEVEISAMAQFISSINTDIPWSFLGFYPHFRFDDLPCTSRKQAEVAVSVARDFGIKNTHLGNVHLLQ